MANYDATCHLLIIHDLFMSNLVEDSLQVIPVNVAKLLKGGGHEDSTRHATFLLCLDELV